MVYLTVPGGVIKRDAGAVPFDGDKIRSGLKRAGAASGEFGENGAEFLTAQVTKILIHKPASKIDVRQTAGAV